MNELQKSYYAIIPANVRYDNDLREKLEQIAIKEDRSLSNLIIKILKDYVKVSSEKGE